MGTTKKFIVQFTEKDLLELGLIGCASCVKATKTKFHPGYSHPPNNHFMDQKGKPCAHCACKKYEPAIRRGTQVQVLEIRKKRRPSDPTIQYADMNADMVSIIRRQVEEIGDPFTAIPFLDDCVAQVIKDRKEAREALAQVKVDYLNKKAKLPMKTHALIEHTLRKQ